MNVSEERTDYDIGSKEKEELQTYEKEGRTYFKFSPEKRAELEYMLSQATGPDYGKIAADFSDQTLNAIYVAANSEDPELAGLASLITYEGMRSLIEKQIVHYGIKKWISKDCINPEFEDFMQSAYIVILESLHKYIPGKGSQIQNILLVDIKREFTDARNSKAGIRLPKHVNDTYNLILPIIQELRALENESPSAEAIAAYYNYTYPDKRSLSPQTVANVLAAKKKTDSIVSYDVEGITATQKATAASPLAALLQEEEIRELYNAIDSIPPEKQDLVRCLMAVYASPDRISDRTGIPYREVAAIYKKYCNANVSEEWVRKNLRGLITDMRYRMTKHYNDDPIIFNGFDAVVTIGEAGHLENEDILKAFTSDPSKLFA